MPWAQADANDNGGMRFTTVRPAEPAQPVPLVSSEEKHKRFEQEIWDNYKALLRGEDLKTPDNSPTSHTRPVRPTSPNAPASVSVQPDNIEQQQQQQKSPSGGLIGGLLQQYQDNKQKRGGMRTKQITPVDE